MKVVLIGATGNIGGKVAAELVSRGKSVTAIAQRRQDTGLDECPGKERRRYRRFARGSRCGREFCTLQGLSPSIIEAVKPSGVKHYIMVGVAGSLEFAPGKMLKNTLTLPEPVEKILDEAAISLQRLRGETGLGWTFVSPAAEIGPGEGRGKFRLGGDQLLTDACGTSRVFYDAAAIALVDELEKPVRIRKRFTIAY